MNTATIIREAPADGAGRANASAESESLIDRDSHFNGRYETRQNLRIEGLAEGEILCQGTLLVAEGARVKAKVTASTITIAGQLDGEVVCRGVFQILPSGQVQASVSAHRLIVREGGVYNGEFRMIGDAEPAAGDGAGEPEIGSDEWWKKLNEGELSAGDDGKDRLEENSP